MNLSNEQINIINAKEDSFKINAVAGSGKTTTLLEYAKNNSNLRILYLAYNKSLQVSIQEKLKEYEPSCINHMRISTIHALAYKYTNAYQYKLTHDLKIQVIEKCLCQYEQETNQKNNYFPIAEYIALIKDLVNYYCNSSLIALDLELLKKYKKQSELGVKIIKLLENDEQKALNHLKHILSAMKNKKIDVIHDFYLKMFYLNKKILKTLPYDLILVDEAQDISDVMIAIIEEQNCRRIYIGDSFQQIYSFRYAINALHKIDLPSYTLSKSFRFGNTYAKVLENNLNDLYKLQTNKLLNISGTSNITNEGKNVINLNKPYCVIARSTFGLIQEIVQLLKKDKKIFFEGGYSSYSFMNQTVYSLFYLKEKKFDKITLSEIKEFDSIQELEEFAKDTKNQDFLNVIKFINTYGDNIFDINKKIKEKLTNKKEDADIIFTTTHKSKGQEYDQVIMANDFISKKDITNPKNKMSYTQVIEELNIYYVAATRAKKAIQLSCLNTTYTYAQNEQTKTIANKYKKKTTKKKMKNLQEEWLENNRVKKDAIF